jgi:hypothetical protein
MGLVTACLLDVFRNATFLRPVDQASVVPGTMLVCRLLHRGAGDALFAPV